MPVKEGANWGFFARNRVRLSYALVVALLVTCIVFNKIPTALWSTTGLIAFGCMVCGVVLRGWSAGVIHKDRQLATTGPYSLSRHPLYLGSWLMLTGALIMLGGNWIGLVFAVLMGALYWPTLRNEERVLADAFPDQWSAYCRATGRLLPKQLPNLRASWSAKQWLLNRDYETLILMLSAVVVLQGVRQLILL